MRFLVALALVFSLISLAEDLPEISSSPQLMEPRGLAQLASRYHRSSRTRTRSRWHYRSSSYRYRGKLAVADPIHLSHQHSRAPGRQLSLLSIQFGFLGKQQNSNADILGMDASGGFRGAYRLKFLPQIALEPSVGYFFSHSGTQGFGVTGHRFELGVSALYHPKYSYKASWHAGLAQRFDLLVTRIKAQADGNSGTGFAYRVGPTAGFLFRVAPATFVRMDLEFTFDLFNAARFHTTFVGGLSIGL